MLGYFARDCTAGTVDSADNTASTAVVGKMQTTVTADSPVMDELLK